MARLLADPKLGLLEYSTGRPVMRGDVALFYHLAPLPFEIGRRGSGVIETVPAFDPAGWSDEALSTINVRGVTDLASIPKLGRVFFPPDGQYVGAALAHDDGYVSRGWGRRTRAEVDQLLLDLMRDAGTPWWRREIVYRAVRIGGAAAWGR